MNAKKLIGYFLFGASIGLIIAGIYYNNSAIKIERQKPTIVGYRELVEKTDDYSVYRNCEYRLKTVTYDTIRNRELSTIETPRVIEVKINSDDSILESAGIMWDNKKECFIQKSKCDSK